MSGARRGGERTGARLGVMGGTFDPIHHGHLVAASEVAASYGLDEVVFVPAGRPYRKLGGQVTAAEDRYLMTVIATSSDPRFSVSRVDIDRPGPTYTRDTLADLRSERRSERGGEHGPDSELLFITGADALAQILTWQDAPELLAENRFVGVTRPGYATTLPEGLPPDRVEILEIPALAISSTGCRERVRQGLPVRYLVPEGVVTWIEKRGLYR